MEDEEVCLPQWWRMETSQIWPLDMPLPGHFLQPDLGELDLPFLTSQPDMWASTHCVSLDHFIHAQLPSTILFMAMCLEHIQVYCTAFLPF